MISLFKKPLGRLITITIVAFLLRTVALGAYPIGLYSDETAFGYNAYLLLKTGHDEYGRFWPMSFESFGDWKPPMQGWLSIPVIAVLGLTEFAVRFPSAILGTGTVIVIYFLAKELFAGKSHEEGRLIAETSSAFLAISPWHIFLSRTAMLVSVELFFVCLGVLSLLKGLKNSGWWLIAALSFSGALYSYYGSRVTVPLLLVSFVLAYARKIFRSFRRIIFPLIVGALLLTPLIIAALMNPLVLTGRAKTTSIFFNDNVRLQLWDSRTKAGLKKIPPVITRFFDNKPYYYVRDISERYLSHFSPQFLFLEGDNKPPFKIPRLGYLHIIDLPFFLIGLYLLRKEGNFFLLLYLLVSPFVASLTFLTPAANRSFNMVIPWTLVTSYGFVKIYSIKNFWNILKPLVVSAYTFSLVIYSYSYVRLIPSENPHFWHYGRRELIGKLQPLIGRYQTIYLTNKGGPPYIFLSFYLKISPEEFHRTVVRNPVINKLGWGHVDRLLQITIPREFDWNEVPKDKYALYVGFENEIPSEDLNVIDQINYPNGKTAYKIGVLK